MPMTYAEHEKKMKSPAVCELLPLRDLPEGDNVMIRTNGAFVASYELRGILAYFATDSDRNQTKAMLEALFRSVPDVIVSCINNAIVQRKEMDNSDWAMHPRSFFCDFRIPSMEPRMSSINSSTSFGQLLANSRLANDQTPSSGFSCGA